MPGVSEKYPVEPRQTPMTLSEHYRPRPIRFLELWQMGGWRLQIYGITYTQKPLDQALLHAARRVVVVAERLTACTWNLYLIGHERDAWGKRVLQRHDDPDLESYLNDRLDGKFGTTGRARVDCADGCT